MEGKDAAEIQRTYYAASADKYNAAHISEDHEHAFSLSILVGLIDFLNIRSILDIGSGTGRAIAYIQKMRPDIRIRGIEPVSELRDVAYASGISTEILVDGNALGLDFNDGEFDLVCEFGVLHHIRQPDVAVGEMIRVARKAIFISDSNNFGQGNALNRFIKQTARLIGIWPALDFIKTKGRGYTISEGDGLAYSYSVFNNYRQVRKSCSQVYLVNTKDGGLNAFRSASHVAMLGIKKSDPVESGNDSA